MKIKHTLEELEKLVICGKTHATRMLALLELKKNYLCNTDAAKKLQTIREILHNE